MPQVFGIDAPAADVYAATVAALSQGKAVLHAPDYATWDLSGRCEREVIIERRGAGHFSLPGAIPGTSHPNDPAKGIWVGARTLALKVQCRKCASCLRAKRMKWTNGAVREFKASSRTWLVTLTFKPGLAYQLLCKARLRLSEGGGDFDALSRKDQQKELLREYAPLGQAFLCRLRVGHLGRAFSTIRFRYLWVVEPHKSGNLHFHMLLHEVSRDMPIVQDRIIRAWGDNGFVHARLVKSPEGAAYAAKYLGKDFMPGRVVRASQHYGQVPDQDPGDPFIENPGGGVPPKPGGASPQEKSEEIADLVAVPRESDADEEEAPTLQVGEDLSVSCVLGLHIGMRCDCALAEGEEQEEIEPPDKLRRGFFQPRPGPGQPRKRSVVCH